MFSDQELDDDLDLGVLRSQPPPESYQGSAHSVFNLDDEDEDVDAQHMPRPPLRSKPAMYFSGHRSAATSEFGFSASAAGFHPRPPAPSHMSGSTLRSSLDHSITHSYPRKGYSAIDPLDLPADIIAALNESQLYLNPIHRRLQHNYAELSQTLTKYIGRDLAAGPVTHAVPRHVVPDIYQGT